MPTNTHENCIFCKIINNEISAEKIYEDDEVLGFLDRHPVHPGHTLIVPKDHFENVYTVPAEIWARMNIAVQKVALAIKEGVDADGINIISNNEPAAGQVIFHSHIHLVPRHNDDGLKHWPGKDATDSELKDIAEKIKKVALA